MNRRNFCKLMAGTLALAAAKPVEALASPASAAVPARRCRLTVVRRTVVPELQARYLDDPEAGPCPLMTVGEVWLIGPHTADPTLPPRGMCPTAWASIAPRLAAGVSCSPEADRSGFLVSCGDPTRAVIFRVDYDAED